MNIVVHNVVVWTVLIALLIKTCNSSWVLKKNINLKNKVAILNPNLRAIKDVSARSHFAWRNIVDVFLLVGHAINFVSVWDVVIEKKDWNRRAIVQKN